MKKIINQLALLFTIITIVSCSNDTNNDFQIVHTKEFLTKEAESTFINRNGTVYLTVSGSFKDTDPDSKVTERGFVFGLNSEPTVGDSNTEIAIGPQDNVTGNLRSLEKGKTYYIRGYFKMNDGSFFYGNEIQASTEVDFSTTRTLKMTMKPDPFWRSTTEMTPQLDVTELTQESPVELGFEYSLKDDFSDSIISIVDLDMNQNFRVTFYQKVLSGLTPVTKYYFRPYAKYADGTITHGGVSTAELSTN
ncbi:conserved protein of unknown function [Tenacibaculum sp. 190524A02b]|uniref:Uncharacterized protein n=1 Tax=Tenacibaculum vairaonense TaxID=3137860 RepID=A0ABM9PKL5_9FLAO